MGSGRPGASPFRDLHDSLKTPNLVPQEQDFYKRLLNTHTPTERAHRPCTEGAPLVLGLCWVCVGGLCRWCWVCVKINLRERQKKRVRTTKLYL